MSLTFEELFNVLSLVIAKLHNHTKLTQKGDKTYCNILIRAYDIMLANNYKQDLEELLNFLSNQYNRYEKHALDIEYNYRQIEIEEEYDEEDIPEQIERLEDYEYSVTLSKEASILLQNILGNLKGIFYDKDKKLMIPLFFEKTKERKSLPIYLNEDNEYQLRRSFFIEGEELLKEVCCDIFRNEKHSDKILKDNSNRHKYYVSSKGINKVRELDNGSREWNKQQNIKNGKDKV
ncbi:MAG: hypothetical protein JJW01_00975 [Alphaproteobacteria bacterium]|nr:hypothetical protein [Rickettsiales bacterium]